MRDSKTAPPEAEDPWQAMIGWLDDDPVDDIDEAIYGPTGSAEVRPA